MTFTEKIKTPFFWKNTLKVSILFFILLIIFGLLFNSFSSILKFDIEAVKTRNFSEGKWKNFVFSKGVIALLYGIFITAKNMK